MKDCGGGSFQFENTGRYASAHAHIIGIDDELNTFAGYDNQFDADGDPPNELTPDERRELADFMIARWTEYRNKGK